MPDIYDICQSCQQFWIRRSSKSMFIYAAILACNLKNWRRSGA